MPAIHAFPVEQQKITRVRIVLDLPDDLCDHYASQAESHGRTLEAEMADRLRRTKDYTAQRPLYFDDDQRAQIERATGHLAMTEGQVLNRILRTLAVKVASIKVVIPARLQERLRSRVFRGHTFEEVVAREVIAGLERYAGLRP